MICSYASHLAIAVVLVSVIDAPAGAQSTTQSITFSVNAINQIAFSGAPSLTISVAAAGAAPNTITDATATWAVTTNQTTAKITASIGAVMPAGLTLFSNLGAPTGAASVGVMALGTVAVDLVTGITKIAQSGMMVTYSLSATAAAGVVASSSRIVTYTITGGT